MSNAVKPNSAKITQLRVARGWTASSLATEAGISPRTVENIERGAKCFVTTIGRIARALDVKCESLSISKIVTPPDDPTCQCEITLSRPRVSLDESDELAAILASFKRIIGAKGRIYVIAIEDGSVVITLAMRPDDIARAVSHFPELVAVGIVALRAPAVVFPENALSNTFIPYDHNAQMSVPKNSIARLFDAISNHLHINARLTLSSIAFILTVACIGILLIAAPIYALLTALFSIGLMVVCYVALKRSEFEERNLPPASIDRYLHLKFGWLSERLVYHSPPILFPKNPPGFKTLYLVPQECLKQPDFVSRCQDFS